MKVINAIILIISIIPMATGCDTIGISNAMVSNVTVTEITSNDLDQVMIFAEDKEIKQILFTKDFYSKFKTREKVEQEIKNCISSLSKFRGKEAIIHYYKNEQGDYIFLDIN